MNKFITLDLETTGLDPITDHILIIGYRFNGEGPIYQLDLTSEHLDTRTYVAFEQAIKSANYVKRGHNVKFDLSFLTAKGYEVNGDLDDTSVLAYLSDPFNSCSLKDVVERISEKKVTRLEDFAIRPKKKELAQYLNNPEYLRIGRDYYKKDLMLEYNRNDVLYCDNLATELTTSDWYTKVEQPLVSVLFNMEQRGIQLDTEYLQNLGDEYEKEIKEIEAEFKEINPRSTRQLASYLQEKGVKLLEKTEKGSPKTDKLVLRKLSWENNESATRLLRFRELSKLQSTYVGPLLFKNLAGRIHGSFNQVGSRGSDTGTRTGRLTSSNPNLQNIPSRTKEGNKIRRAFIPTPGYVMFDSDLKQIEPRLVAHYTQNKLLLEAYAKNQDTHAIMGGIIFGKSPESLTKLERFIGKTSWLALFYGCSAKKLKVIAETLSEDPIPFDISYFHSIADRLEKGNPELFSWRRSHIEMAKKVGYVKTIGGRVVQIPNINSRNPWEAQEAERKAVNYLIQGSAADIMKMILVEFKSQFVDLGYGHLLAVVHDEVLGESLLDDYERDSEHLLDIITHIMSDTVRLNGVKIESDTKFVSSWSEK